MQLSIETHIIIDADAQTIWQVLAQQFEAVSCWASVVNESHALHDSPLLPGAHLSGRVCTVQGLGQTHEALTHFDAQGMRFTYDAKKGLPSFILRASNTWCVEALGPKQARVTAQAQMVLKRLPGMLLAPIFKYQIRRLGQRTFEELKYFIEHGEVHPRKRKLLQIQRKKISLPS